MKTDKAARTAEKAKKSGKRRLPSMRSKVLLSLVLFSAAVLLVMWLFQSFLFGPLYRSVRTTEVKKCAASLKKCDADSLERECERLGRKYNICVSVFTVGPAGETRVAEWHNVMNPVCFIHSYSSDSLVYDLYMEARETGQARKTVKVDVPGEGKTPDADNGESMIFAYLTERDGGETLIVLNTFVRPLASTEVTLRIITLIVTGFVIAAAAILSLILSRRLSRPIVSMSGGAGRLAAGDYGVRFGGGGYREADELAETLNLAAREMGQTDRMRRDLIANVSHDLRTPLTIISGYSEIMRDIPGEMTAKNIQTVIDETKTLSTLVNDMLESSKLSDGAVTLRPETFDMGEAVSEAVRRYAAVYGPQGYSITAECDGGPVTADRMRIGEALYNLLNNAVNYTGDDKKIFVRQTARNGRVRVEITDTGDGIPEEELPLIWDRYYKSKEFHRRTGAGTGLGLSIVKNILILHGAEFGVRSRKGEGSTFWFELAQTDNGREE